MLLPVTSEGLDDAPHENPQRCADPRAGLNLADMGGCLWDKSFAHLGYKKCLNPPTTAMAATQIKAFRNLAPRHPSIIVPDVRGSYSGFTRNAIGQHKCLRWYRWLPFSRVTTHSQRILATIETSACSRCQWLSASARAFTHAGGRPFPGATPRKRLPYCLITRTVELVWKLLAHLPLAPQ